MKKVSELFDEKLIDDLNHKLMEKHLDNMSDIAYRTLFESYHDPSLYIETALIMSSLKEAASCKTCKEINECSNKLQGHKLVLNYKNKLEEVYEPCNYYLEIIRKKRIYYVGVNSELYEAKLEKIYVDDASRMEILQVFKELLSTNSKKGIYLHGKFGTGKTYMMSAFLNKLSESYEKCGLVYFPRLLVELKNSYTDKTNYLDKIMMLDVLVIDDLGAEHMTSWSRDEVLGTILQYRMENRLLTLFTSNLSISELERFYSRDKSEVNARRIIDRIKFLSSPYALFNKQYR